MKKTMYISGPITDLKTGLPREGWQEDFQAAEERLRGMGFNVINPVDIARETEEEWRQQLVLFRDMAKWNKRKAKALSSQPTRGTYITACIQTMNTEALAGRLDGVYVLGSSGDAYAKKRIRRSAGVMMELHMAAALGIPVFSQFYHGNETDVNLLPVKDGRRLLDNGTFGMENWSDRGIKKKLKRCNKHVVLTARNHRKT